MYFSRVPWMINSSWKEKPLKAYVADIKILYAVAVFFLSKSLLILRENFKKMFSNMNVSRE